MNDQLHRIRTEADVHIQSMRSHGYVVHKRSRSALKRRGSSVWRQYECSQLPLDVE